MHPFGKTSSSSTQHTATLDFRHDRSEDADEPPCASVASKDASTIESNGSVNRSTNGDAIPDAAATLDAEAGRDIDPPAVPGFSVGSPIGHGGYAVVWSGARLEDGAPAALKIGHADNALTNERFRRDAEAAALLGPPHAPRLFASGRLDDGRPFIAMELLTGRTLAAILDGLADPPGAELIRRVGGAVLEALASAHAKGIVHRDLKPENIVLDENEGRAVLLDFGLARSTSQDMPELTRTGVVVGTPEYMAPEQLVGARALDERTDIYAFGVILFRLLTLRLPFTGDIASIEHGHLTLRPPRPSDLAQVPEELEAIALACLAKDPARRPASADELNRSLAHACSLAGDGARRLIVDRAPMSSGQCSSETRAAKLLAEGRRPAVLLVADTTAGAVPVNDAVTRLGGFIARQRGNRYVCVFSGSDAGDPVRTAIAAARDLVCRFGARAALHLATLTVRQQEEGPPAVYGKDLERPERWTPDDWSGVVLTADLARVVPPHDIPPFPEGAAFVAVRSSPTDEHAPSASGPGAEFEPIIGGDSKALHASPSGVRPTKLVGQEPLLAALAAGVAAAFDGGCAGIFTLLGDHGLGKSRLATEAAALAARVAPSATVLTIRAEPPLAGEEATTTRELFLWLLGVESGSGTAPPNLRELCVERLGSTVDEEVLQTVASVLGFAPDGPRVEAAEARSAAMRAIAEGLRLLSRKGPVAIIVDDAHWADDSALDALEYATLDASSPLWVFVAAHPRLENVRRMWGARAQRNDRAVLAPLAEEAAMQLAAELLLPAEFPPAAFLRHLASWAGGNPACLVDLVRALKRAGIVRRRRATGSYYVATAELAELPASTAWQWLAVRQLDALPPELAACVRLCSVLGVRFSRAEVERVQEAIDRAGGAGTPVDPGVGLGALVEWKILRRAGEDLYSFQSATFQDAVYKLLDPARREQTHRRAFEVWQAYKNDLLDVAAAPARIERTTWTDDWERDDRGGFQAYAPGDSVGPGDARRPEYSFERARGGSAAAAASRERARDALERLARHAGACGERDEAAAAYLCLGESAAAAHRHVEADHHYAAALSYLADDDAAQRAVTLAKRGKIRYRLYRVPDALDDFRAARALAAGLGDDALMADILLEEATALDHANDFLESARRVDEARPLIERLGDESLELRYLVALGRSRWRQERVGEAIDLLSRGADGAKANGDHDTRVIALLLVSCALAVEGRVDEAIARYIEVIELCMKVGDRLHLGMAYLNRTFLRLARNQLDEGVKDLRRATQLAREVGNPWLERAATVNTAELLHWMGAGEEALVFARRSCVLVERFVDHPLSDDWLLCARIHLMQGQIRDARDAVDRIARSCLPSPSAPTAYALFRMLELVLAEVGERPVGGGDGSIEEIGEGSAARGDARNGASYGDAWEELLSRARGRVLVQELLEVLYWRARMAIRGGRWGEAEEALRQAAEPLIACPGLKGRFDELIYELSDRRAAIET